MLPRESLFVIAVALLCFMPPLATRADSTPNWVNDSYKWTSHRVHYKWLQDNPVLPKTVMILPVQIEVVEVSAGGVTEIVPEWSKAASQNVSRALAAALRKQGVHEIAAPNFSGTVAANVDEHLALYKLVIRTAERINWEHKFKHFDYSIGPGLNEIAGQYGVDVAIIALGREAVSTAGRKTLAIAGTIPLVNIMTGPGDMGAAFIHVGVIDLRTGDLLWMNNNHREGSADLREADDASEMIDAIFSRYPGIDSYRDAYMN